MERELPAAVLTTHAAVDLNQFRNTQVGKGYQAKHVIRQRLRIEDSAVSVRDLTKKTLDLNKRKSKKKPNEAPSSSFDDHTKRNEKTSTATRLQNYLQCEGLRKFRRELESIDSSTS